MDRPLVYAGQVPRALDNLNLGQFAMVGLAKLAEALLGTATAVPGGSFAVTPGTGLTISVGPGQIYQLESLEATAASALNVDGHQVLKQGFALDAQTITLSPPSTNGYAQNILIQAAYQEVDGGSLVLSYQNPTPVPDPTTGALKYVTYPGPGGNGQQQVTIRQGRVNLVAKPGVAATSGSQTTPAPDTGYVGLYVVTLTAAQTTISSGNITVAPNAPFIPVTLPGVPAGVQAGQWLYAGDTGTSGALIAALAPTPTALPDGMEIHVKAANAAAGGDTINVSGLGVLPIRRRGSGLAPAAKDWSAGDILTLRKIGSVWQVASMLPSDVLATITGSGTVPVILQSPIVYVRPDGNDTTGDGSANTAAKAFATIGAAATYARQKYYLAAVTLTIQLGVPGTYSPTGSLDAGGGTINIIGDVSNAAGYIVQGAGPAGGASGLIASTHGTINLSGVTMSNTGSINSCVAATGTGSMSLTSVIFSTNVATCPALISAFSGGSITVFSGCVFNGYANSALLMSAGYITMAASINISNTPQYSTAFCVAQNCGVFSISGAFTFTGTTAVGPRYLATTNGVIGTNGGGANFFPGNAAGSTATGGVYG